MRKPVSLIVLGCVVAACSPDAPAATTSPDATPSAVVTSDGATPGGSASTPGATGSAGSGASVDPSQDPLYLEAVEVYRAYHAEMAKLESHSYEPATLPATMDTYITGTMKEAIQNSITNSLSEGLAPARGSSSRLTAIAPNPGVSRGGSLVSIRVCVDSTEGEVIDTGTGKVVGNGGLAYKEIYFQRFDGKLKGFTSDSKAVETCPL
ncbi:hypothetical protein ACTQ49_05450 [Luteococcus sp. Sow4_B9]|uniref:hypothetical protein n=1 Tax=Luteococcus sp. Sow4_B9 TaxID=3438792 RepID=UPI003F9EB678